MVDWVASRVIDQAPSAVLQAQGQKNCASEKLGAREARGVMLMLPPSKTGRWIYVWSYTRV